MEKGVSTKQALQLNKISKFDCFFLFQMDRTALTDGCFTLPDVLSPPDSSYFSEVCLLFLVHETLIPQLCPTKREQDQVIR
jgi:hypothetical protein